ncbi:thioesterase II family protein [Telmatospirillum siberiense]|uniref:Thioesterase n=1 Tax=Telmatospirillum siberiense TaxID=382514 RepID=A0A2N3PNU6_9PROT|nr:alpha/beta fold hydrolase [Telmatospirillum siberiense]PKU22083.1 thioesterase [Telmatospirillum siberiense]
MSEREPAASGAIRVLAQPDPFDSALFFFPYAGGSASSGRRLIGALPDNVLGASIQYPGRGDRRHEDQVGNIERLAEIVCEEIVGLSFLKEKPLFLFGHSMGAALAFEVCRLLENAQWRPARLIVSGRRAPSSGLGFPPPANDDAILAHLKETGAVPETLLKKSTFRDSILFAVRNDFNANAQYKAGPDTRLHCDILFLLAASDPYVDEHGAKEWAAHTEADFTIARFDGGHFFIDENLSALVPAALRGVGR